MDCNVQRTLLPSAARTVATACPVQNEVTARALRLYLSVTAASGTGGLQPIIRGYDKVSGNTVSLSTGGTAIVAVGTYCYEMGLGIGAASGNIKECQNRPAPVQWDVNVVAGDGTSYTYSLSVEVLR